MHLHRRSNASTSHAPDSPHPSSREGAGSTPFFAPLPDTPPPPEWWNPFSVKVGPVKLWRLTLVVGIFVMGIVGWFNGGAVPGRPAAAPVGVVPTVPAADGRAAAGEGLHICATREFSALGLFCRRNSAVLTLTDINAGAAVSFMKTSAMPQIPPGAYAVLVVDRGPRSPKAFKDDSAHIRAQRTAVSWRAKEVLAGSGALDGDGLVPGDTYSIELDPGTISSPDHLGYTTFVYDHIIKPTPGH